MKKWLFWVIVISLAAFGVAAKLSVKKSEQGFITQKLGRGNITELVTATGTINPISNIEVGTQVSGTIKKIYVDYNTEVKTGQPLAQIDPALFESNVTKEKANLQVAKAQVQVAQASLDYYTKHLARIKKLNQQNYSADRELDEAQKNYDASIAQVALSKAQVAQVQAALNYHETQLAYAKIESPVDGIVVSKSVEEGQTVAASFSTPTLFIVAEDLTKMKIEASVVEADISKVKENQTVEFSVDSYPDDVFQGTVTQVRNEAITNSNVVTYIVIIEVDNSDLKFKPGMTANVEIITAKKDSALLVSSKALRFSIDDGATRYKNKGIWIMEDGKPRRIEVITGVYDDENTEISAESQLEGKYVIVDKSSNSKPTANNNMRMRMR